jgi:transglutaminase-like putative cysteine protease
MRYRVRHTTSYRYETSVVHAHHLAHLRPRNLPNQRVERSEVVAVPAALRMVQDTDYFGNPIDRFEVLGVHDTLEVTAQSVVSVEPNPFSSSPPLLDVSWENVVEELDENPAELSIQEFRLVSPLIRTHAAAREYAMPTFLPRRPLMAAIVELNQRIFEEFSYQIAATDVSTPLQRVFSEKRGVCQDFAHVAVACLRSLGLAARYVSGYLETTPPAGKPRLIGADASHAWPSVYVPQTGWFDFDPTNNVLPSDQHVTVGWGRDFSDVSPLKGVVLGGGSHRVTVGVDVERMPAAG